MNMKSLLFICFIITNLPTKLMESSPFSSYQWKNRILVIYTNDTDIPPYEQQLANFELHEKAYHDRDLIVLLINKQFVYRLPQNQMLNISAGQAQDFLSIEENESFHVSLIGKDGTIKHEARTPISNQKLFAIIDAMPMRQSEIGN